MFTTRRGFVALSALTATAKVSWANTISSEFETFILEEIEKHYEDGTLEQRLEFLRLLKEEELIRPIIDVEADYVEAAKLEDSEEKGKKLDAIRAFLFTEYSIKVDIGLRLTTK